ncbi:hypothetical protein CRYUN_Cryun04dG0065500 [Craigia yunnanensis]
MKTKKDCFTRKQGEQKRKRDKFTFYRVHEDDNGNFSSMPYSSRNPFFFFLQLSNYNSFEGVLYCRPHYDQLFKRTGSLDKSFEGTPKIVKPEKHIENENAQKVVNSFGGTREKCVGCNKTVYPIEKVTVNGTPYHKSCFKCTHGGCTISPSNYIAHEGKLYCKHHHIQLFKEKGNYSQLESDREKNSMTEKLTSMEIAAES